jgi:hypothetical protein
MSGRIKYVRFPLEYVKLLSLFKGLEQSCRTHLCMMGSLRKVSKYYVKQNCERLEIPCFGCGTTSYSY